MARHVERDARPERTPAAGEERERDVHLEHAGILHDDPALAARAEEDAKRSGALARDPAPDTAPRPREGKGGEHVNLGRDEPFSSAARVEVDLHPGAAEPGHHEGSGSLLASRQAPEGTRPVVPEAANPPAGLVGTGNPMQNNPNNQKKGGNVQGEQGREQGRQNVGQGTGGSETTNRQGGQNIQGRGMQGGQGQQNLRGGQQSGAGSSQGSMRQQAGQGAGSQRRESAQEEEE